MKERDWWIVGGVAAAGALLWWQWDAIADIASGEPVMRVFGRGGQLTNAPAGEDGVVWTEPGILTATASRVMGRELAEGVYGLARMLRSEGAAQGRLRVHVALNDAAAKGWDVMRLLTYSTNAMARGFYGEQYTPASRAPGGARSSRRYSTARDPYAGDVQTAEDALLEHAAGVDPTEGAVKFIDKSSMGRQEGSRSYEEVASEWAAEGLRPFTLPGYGSDLVLFRRG